jgi:ribosomal protein S12 methylthiotransferase accessory factor
MATAQGAWLTTARGNFAMNRESRALLWQSLAYFTGQDSVAPVDGAALQTTLLQAGALAFEAHAVAVVEPPATPTAIHGSSAFTRRLTDALAKRGLTQRSETGAGLVAIEWNADDATIARRLRDCYRRGVPHWVVAVLVGDRIVMARIEPGRSACWDCLYRRLGLPPAPPKKVISLPDPAIEALADNLWIEKQFSTVAVEHCVMIEANGPPSLHVALPLPGCPRCADVLRRPQKGLSTLRDALVPPELLVLADRELGILRELLIYQPADPGLPAFPVCASARLALPRAHGKLRRIRGEGKGANRDEAIIGAIGEGIERYAASSWDPAALFRMAFDKDPAALFDPRDLALYGAQQYETPGFPYTRFDPRQPLCWARGKWLDSGAAVGVPAIAVYLGFPTSPHECLAQTTSNGLATGRGVADATLRALYELIERDALMRAWMTNDAPLWRLSNQGIGQDAEAALTSLASENAQIELYLLGDHSRHATVLCVGWGDGNHWPGVTMGLGTHASLDVALRKAVFEHSHYGLYMQRLMREGRHHGVAAPSDVRSNLDHGLLYVDPAWQGPVREMTAGASFLPLDQARLRFTQPATLEACVGALNAVGIRAAAVDVTPADIAMTPCRVVRAVASGLQPIHFGYGMQRCGHERLRWIARATLPHPIA